MEGEEDGPHDEVHPRLGDAEPVVVSPEQRVERAGDEDGGPRVAAVVEQLAQRGTAAGATGLRKKKSPFYVKAGCVLFS